MIKIGSVKEIWRYPVKGMAGEQVAQCQLDQNGFFGDRRYAVRDTLRNEIQSCKFRPQLLSCIARYSDTATINGSEPNLQINFPDGSTLPFDSSEVHGKISALLGHESSLEALSSLSGMDAFHRYTTDKQRLLNELNATFEREPGEAGPDFSAPSEDFLNFVTLPGSYFLVSPLHILTSASIAYCKNLLPSADWDIRRFRPNLVIETQDQYSGLAEQQWLGKKLHVGKVVIDCNSTAIRCGAITRQQQGIPFNKTILRSIVKEADQNLGIYGDISGQGRLSVGDAIYLSD